MLPPAQSAQCKRNAVFVSITGYLQISEEKKLKRRPSLARTPCSELTYYAREDNFDFCRRLWSLTSHDETSTPRPRSRISECPNKHNNWSSFASSSFVLCRIRLQKLRRHLNTATTDTSTSKVKSCRLSAYPRLYCPRSLQLTELILIFAEAQQLFKLQKFVLIQWSSSCLSAMILTISSNFTKPLSPWFIAECHASCELHMRKG